MCRQNFLARVRHTIEIDFPMKKHLPISLSKRSSGCINLPSCALKTGAAFTTASCSNRFTGFVLFSSKQGQGTACTIDNRIPPALSTTKPKTEALMNKYQIPTRRHTFSIGFIASPAIWWTFKERLSQRLPKISSAFDKLVYVLKTVVFGSSAE